MGVELPFPAEMLLGATLARGTVVEGHDAVEPHVCIDGETRAWPCDVLTTPWGADVSFRVGDSVLVWLPPSGAGRGVVVGRIGRTRVDGPPEPRLPDELVIEAREQLTLRVGDGSITIRADGKILIKGKDLVSHAQRMNRVKGGAVAIN